MNNVTSKKDKKGNLILEYNKTSGMYITLMTSDKKLSNNVERLKFIKKTEGLIRKSDRYKLYKKKLFDSGLNMCAILGNVTDEKAKIEMHHGPIFTLWDYVEITIQYLYSNDLPISSFRVADQVLNDHFEDLIQVVMISESVHKVIHNPSNNTLIIPLESAWGDLVGYLKKYKGCFDYKHFAKLNDYLGLPIENRDFDLFETSITQWRDIKTPNIIPSLEEIRHRNIS